MKCVNSNINVNGIDITQITQDSVAGVAANEGVAAYATNTQNGNGLYRINFDRNLVNTCVDVNENEQIKVSPAEEEPEPEPIFCEECFSDLTESQKDDIANVVEWETLSQLCGQIEGTPNDQNERNNVIDYL